MQKPTLYTHPFSRGANVVWMLKECGAEYDVELIGFGRQIRSPQYLAINPMGKVPALKTGDTVLTETVAIITWLAEQFPEKRLIPAAATPERGEYYRWLCFAIHLEYAAFEKQNGWTGDKKYRRSVGHGDFETAFGVLRERLRGRTFILGDHFSALDLHYTGLLNYFVNVMPILAADETFAAYVARHAARPAFAETMKWAQQAAAELNQSGE